MQQNPLCVHLQCTNLPAQAGLSHGGRSDCTAPGSASGSYPERKNKSGY